MSESILTSTKKLLGLDEEYEAFDMDIVIYINTVFSVLHQLGVGPADGFAIEDASANWVDFIEDFSQRQLAKSFVYVRVRLLFDPPTTSYLLESMNKIAQELEYRISVDREGDSWTDPTVPSS